jgi:hypothetical protein
MAVQEKMEESFAHLSDFISTMWPDAMTEMRENDPSSYWRMQDGIEEANRRVEERQKQSCIETHYEIRNGSCDRLEVP